MITYLYKIITKIIAMHLKPLLPTPISLEKSGYVEGCQIMDSVILEHKIVHSLITTHSLVMMIKLDFPKAFDRINRKYMRVVLTTFGFSQEWIYWVL